MVLGKKTNFSCGKLKNPSFETLCGQTPKSFCLFSLRKKMVLDGKTNFFLGKRWFRAKNQLFPRKGWFWREKPTFS